MSSAGCIHPRLITASHQALAVETLSRGEGVTLIAPLHLLSSGRPPSITPSFAVSVVSLPLVTLWPIDLTGGEIVSRSVLPRGSDMNCGR